MYLLTSFFLLLYLVAHLAHAALLLYVQKAKHKNKAASAAATPEVAARPASVPPTPPPASTSPAPVQTAVGIPGAVVEPALQEAAKEEAAAFAEKAKPVPGRGLPELAVKLALCNCESTA